MSNLTRRHFVKLSGAAAALGAVGFAPTVRAAQRKVVVVGGGYGGAVAAKYLKMGDPSLDVTLIEMNKEYVSCPLSNPVIVGIRDIKVQTWGYDGLKKYGVNVVFDKVVGIDPAGKSVKTEGGTTFAYDKCVLSPGVEMKYAAIPGYSEEASHVMPHAWKAGPQTLELGKQLMAMEDGKNFVIVAPPDPYRCPPGPYERASLVAWYLKKHKPKSKVIIVDPKEKFSKQGLFTGAWKELGLPVEWVGADNGKVTKVDAATKTVFTDMDKFEGGVVNVIPPQAAGHIAHVAGLVNDKGWCPVDLKTFESTMHKDIYVIGDSSVATGMPKSGYAANSEAKICVTAILASFMGKTAPEPSYVNTCYSLITPDYGISVALVGMFKDGKVAEISGGVSPAAASPEFRKQEALFAESWYQSIMQDTLR
ncbi:MAG: NAD(P)/FAD-dependent oxidoreductase [Magnetococcus sp. WYHC-3]